MQRKRKLIELLFIFIFVLTIGVLLSNYGASRIVIFNASQEIIPVDKPLRAHALWKAKGVHSRILLLFDRYLNAEKSSHNSVLENNYIYHAVQDDLVRKIYHIVPDVSWPTVENNLKQYPSVTYSQGVFRLTLDEATPVYIMRLKDIPTIKEPVMVLINKEYWSGEDLQLIQVLLEKGLLTSDIIISSGYRSAQSQGNNGVLHGNTP